MKKVAAVGLCLLMLAGCARVQYAIEATPERVQEAFGDPIRRTHIATQVGRVSSSAGVGITCAALLSPFFVAALVCPFIAVAFDFLIYEYVLDPLSWELVREGKPSLVGPYWETGPRADEGEFFTCGTTLTNNPTHVCRPAAP